MRYIELFRKEGEKYRYTLDFDGYATDVKRGQYLEITDKLRNMISNAYEKTMLKPAIEYMQKKRDV